MLLNSKGCTVKICNYWRWPTTTRILNETLSMNLLGALILWRAHFDLFDILSSLAASEDSLDRLVRLSLPLFS